MPTSRLRITHYLLCVLALANIAALSMQFPISAGVLGVAWLLYKTTVRETRSKWLGWMTLGLFAGAFQILDPGDLKPVVFLLAGCYLIGYSESRARHALGMLCLAAAQLPLFVFGGIAYMVWRDLRTGSSSWRSWPAGVIGLFLAGASVNQVEFHAIGRDGFIGFVELLSRRFLVPAALAGAGLQLSLERGRPMSVWIFFLPIAFVSALLSAAAVVPFAIWLILTAALAIPRLIRDIGWLSAVHFPAIALTIALAAFAYTGEAPTFSSPDASLKVLATKSDSSGRNAPRNDGGDDHHRDHGGRSVPVSLVIP